jgi:hypothetical protein
MHLAPKKDFRMIAYGEYVRNVRLYRMIFLNRESANDEKYDTQVSNGETSRHTRLEYHPHARR